MPLTQSAEDGYLTIGLRGNPFDVRFGSLADMRIAKRHVRFTPKSGRNSGHRGSRSRAEHFGSALYFKRLLAPRWRGHRPHQCRDTGQRSLSSCDQQKLDGAQILGAPINQRRLRSPQNVCRTNESSKEITRQLTDRTDIFIGFQWSMGRHKLRDTHGSPNVEENMWDRGPLSGPCKQAFLTAQTRILKLDRLPIEL